MKEFNTVFIDGDQLMYQTGFASEGEPLNFVLGTLKQSLNKIQKSTNADNREIWIKGKGNFRETVSVSTTYKATRPSKKPTYIKEIHDYLVEYQGAQEAHGMEADDMLSVRLYENQEDCILYSQDKDLLNTPGWHAHPRSNPQNFHVDDEEALRHFWYQMLSGDRIDNIPGLPALPTYAFEEYSLHKTRKNAIGEKTAWELMCMSEFSDLPQLVWNLYRDYFKEFRPKVQDLAQAYFEEQGKLLWMARALHPNGAPVLFNPNDWGIDFEQTQAE